MKNSTNVKKGFTIIEIVLVLAIAGLIFAAVFIALPSLWASQRDAARKENIMTFVTTLKNYQTNNSRGALPGTGKDGTAGCVVDYPSSLTNIGTANSETDDKKISDGKAVWVSGPCAVEDRETRTQITDERTWAGFYRDYMTPQFEDPEGYTYNLYVAKCEANGSSLNAGQNCDNLAFSGLVGTNNINQGGRNWLDYTLYVAVGATCDGDTAVKSLNSRKVAVVYKMERTGQFCYNS